MKVKGLALVGLSALAQPRLTKGGQPYLGPLRSYLPCDFGDAKLAYSYGKMAG
jgi:hypothetical protein